MPLFLSTSPPLYLPSSKSATLTLPFYLFVSLHSVSTSNSLPRPLDLQEVSPQSSQPSVGAYNGRLCAARAPVSVCRRVGGREDPAQRKGPHRAAGHVGHVGRQEHRVGHVRVFPVRVRRQRRAGQRASAAKSPKGAVNSGQLAPSSTPTSSICMCNVCVTYILRRAPNVGAR